MRSTGRSVDSVDGISSCARGWPGSNGGPVQRATRPDSGGADAGDVHAHAPGSRYAICHSSCMAVEETRRPRTQAERKAESARELMRAAVEVIAERGWEQSSSAEIALRAGYSGAMVNARYGSRDGLLEALLKGYEERFELGGPRRDRGLDELLDRVEILRDQVRSEPALLRAFLMLCFESVGPAAGHRKWIEAWLDRYARDLAAIIDRGQSDGSIRGDVDARAEAQF